MGKKITVDVKGMHCAACSSRIERVVGNMGGVESASVNLAAETLALEFDEKSVAFDEISQKVTDLGFELLQKQQDEKGKLVVDISGMHCAACSSRIEKVVSDMPGVTSASVNLATEKGTFLFDAAETGPRAIKSKISSLGFAPSSVTKGSNNYEEKEALNRKLLQNMKKRLMAELVLVVPLLTLSMGEMVGLPLPSVLSPQVSPLAFAVVQMILASAIMLLGKHFYLNGFPALFRKSPNMDSLIAVGTGAAFIYSMWNLCEIALGISPYMKAMDLYFESAGVLVALVSLGKYMEAKSKYQTSDAIRMLMQLKPKTAVLLDGDRQQIIDVEDIEVGDILLVKPGANIPTDGEIESGETSIDESLMTGEAMPVKKTKGDGVYGGTVNATNTIRMIAGKTGEDTLLASIIRMVQEAQGSKAPIAKIADRVSYYFVPSVMVFAILTGLSWYVVSDVGFSQSLRFFIAVMVIACPCAMGLATPISVMVGTGRGAQLGILIKNGETIEKMEKVDSVIFDKTGTITVGKPEVTDIIVANGYTEGEILSLAASAEQYSEHPLAEAIVELAHSRKIKLQQPDSFNPSSGKGITAEVSGDNIVIGNRSFCAAYLGSGQDLEKYSGNYAEEGKTVLYAAINGVFAGLLIIADKMKDNVPQVIQKLQQQKISVAMLTGDNQGTANAIAAAAGIEKVIAEVLPDSKAQVVREFQQNGKVVAMVGDGINDAPALAQADIGIAMGTGIDIAIESGDVVIMKGDLEGVVAAVSLSKAVMKNIRQNLFWAFGYNVLGIPVAAGLLYVFGGPALNPMFAGAAMALSSVSVVTNALRLRFFGSKK